MSATLEGALGALRDRGLRLSAARRIVLEALAVADGPMSAEQVAAGVGGRVPRSDLASVYRNLDTLERAGIVHHVHLGHSPGLWALADDAGAANEYLTCERCGDYRVLPASELDAVRGHLRRRFGYTVSFAHFPIVGLCGPCTAAVHRAREHWASAPLRPPMADGTDAS
jgi:Fur family transcriptional regulator, ferric uptake regulator